jgi:hypothetical protein
MNLIIAVLKIYYSEAIECYEEEVEHHFEQKPLEKSINLMVLHYYGFRSIVNKFKQFELKPSNYQLQVDSMTGARAR